MRHALGHKRLTGEDYLFIFLFCDYDEFTLTMYDAGVRWGRVAYLMIT